MKVFQRPKNGGVGACGEWVVSDGQAGMMGGDMNRDGIPDAMQHPAHVAATTQPYAMTQAEGRQLAQALGLKLGGRGYAFVGDYNDKGLYAYKSGKYRGIAFWGQGGGVHAKQKPVTGGGKYRVKRTAAIQDPGPGHCPAERRVAPYVAKIEGALDGERAFERVPHHHSQSDTARPGSTCAPAL